MLFINCVQLLRTSSLCVWENSRVSVIQIEKELCQLWSWNGRADKRWSASHDEESHWGWKDPRDLVTTGEIALQPSFDKVIIGSVSTLLYKTLFFEGFYIVRRQPCHSFPDYIQSLCQQNHARTNMPSSHTILKLFMIFAPMLHILVQGFM